MVKSNNIKNILLILFVLHFGFGNKATCSETKDINRTSKLSETIIDLGTREQYDQALTLIDSIRSVQPDNPYIPLLKATILSARAMDYEDEIDFPDILNACDRTDQLVEAKLKDADQTSELWFYRGMTELYRSVIYQRQGRLFKSIKHVINGGNYLEKAIELDSTNWDVYYGLGMYKYYRSKYAGILRSIGIIPDQRDEGLRYLEIAAEYGSLTRISARNSLAWIAYEKGNYEEAIRIEQDLLKEYNNVRAFNWLLIRALIKSERWEEAITLLEPMYLLVANDERNNYYNEIDCLHKLGVAYFELGKWEEVVKTEETASKLKFSKSVADRKKNDIKHLQELGKLAKDKLSGKTE
ncbi:tetratricopeptide repeat protein [bacterium]|nr:tetratricopeptide repeat protein [bacterium]